MTPEQTTLVERIRALLPADAAVREVSMFGGRAIMLDEKMIVSAGKRGDLLVRVDAASHQALLARPGAAQAVMGVDRDMGPGWITVAESAIADSAELAFWVRQALDRA